MKLKGIKNVSAKILAKTGLHIGGSKDEIKIGGIDNPVIKDPLTNEPYIPGSSLKGKIRTLLEWKLGTIEEDGKPTYVPDDEEWNQIKENKKYHIKIAKIFGNGKTIKKEEIAKKIGPTRIYFYDCYLDEENAKKLRAQNALTEEKIEVVINRVTGSVGGGGPRRMERVPAGAVFNFNLTYLMFDEEDEENFDLIPLGMKLLELTALGGSGSRGYGKIEFYEIKGIDKKFLDENGKLKSIEELINEVSVLKNVKQ